MGEPLALGSIMTYFFLYGSIFVILNAEPASQIAQTL